MPRSKHRFVSALAIAGIILSFTSLHAQAISRVAPPTLPPTGGRYSHVVTTELPAGARLIFIAGQVGADSAGRPVGTTAAEQMQRAYDNLDRALAAAGATWDDVLKTTTILTRASDLPALREVRASRFAGRPAPANTLMVIQALYDPAILFEVEAIAIVRSAPR